MLDFIKNYLSRQGIELCSAIPLSSCKINRPYLLSGIENGTVFLFAVPYFSKGTETKRNVSAYACAEDYHLYFKNLFDGILPLLKAKYKKNSFIAFCDRSPIDEIDASARAGLGVIGKNRLLITEKYSSYVFIGEIITDAKTECIEADVKECLSCGKCQELCPALTGETECLSSLTQKKGELTRKEELIIRESPYAWGCDRCQEICPHTIKAKENNTIYTSIEFFNKNLTPYITSKLISEMADENFSRRAYSWRKKETILRNLKIAESEQCEKKSHNPR